METQKKLTPAQRYYQNNKERRQAYGRAYYQKNKEKILATSTKAREEPPPPPPEPVHDPEPLAASKRRGITQHAPATVVFN
jgi:hypothetical protein